MGLTPSGGGVGIDDGAGLFVVPKTEAAVIIIIVEHKITKLYTQTWPSPNGLDIS